MEILDKIYKIREIIDSITDKDIEDIEYIYKDQLEYINPLKMATTSRQTELGNANKRVVEALKELKEAFNEPILKEDKEK